MQRYASRAAEDWTKLDSASHRAVNAVVTGGLARDTASVNRVIHGKSAPRFLPMAGLSGLQKAGYVWGAFLPVRKDGKLVQLVLVLPAWEASRSLAFRFENGGPNSLHGYWHMQFARSAGPPGEQDLPLQGVPDWLPDSWPAPPIPGKDGLDVFLVMLTAVHGFGGADGGDGKRGEPLGVDGVLKRLWQRAGRSPEWKACMDRLKSMGIAAASRQGA